MRLVEFFFSVFILVPGLSLRAQPWVANSGHLISPQVLYRWSETLTYTRRGNREGISRAYSLDATSLIYDTLQQDRIGNVLSALTDI